MWRARCMYGVWILMLLWLYCWFKFYFLGSTAFVLWFLGNRFSELPLFSYTVSLKI
jgi:hypothetical protein